MAGDYAIIMSNVESGEISWLMLEEGMVKSRGTFRLEGGHRAVPVPPDILAQAERDIAATALTLQAERAYAGRKPKEFGELSGKLLIEDLEKEIDKLREMGSRVPYDLYILFSGGVSQIKEVLDELKME